MSTPVVSNEGELTLLGLIKAGTLKMGLFKSNTTPDNSTVIGDLTDADFSGYTAGGQTLVYGSITTNGSNQATMTATQLTFTHNGGGTSNTIYGYYIYDSVAGTLIKAERFDASISMGSSGANIKVTDTMLQAGTIT